MALPRLLSSVACSLSINVCAGTVAESFVDERLLYSNVHGIHTWTYSAPVDTTFNTLRDKASASNNPGGPQAKAPALRNSIAVPSQELLTLALNAASRHRLDPSLLLALMWVESSFNPKAISSKGAAGLMQLLPATARGYGLKKTSDLFNPSINIDIGSRHLRALLDLHHDNLPLALAAYNAGHGAVRRFGKTIPAYKETMLYVPAVLGQMAAYSATGHLDQ